MSQRVHIEFSRVQTWSSELRLSRDARAISGTAATCSRSWGVPLRAHWSTAISGPRASSRSSPSRASRWTTSASSAAARSLSDSARRELVREVPRRSGPSVRERLRSGRRRDQATQRGHGEEDASQGKEVMTRPVQTDDAARVQDRAPQSSAGAHAFAASRLDGARNLAESSPVPERCGARALLHSDLFRELG
jgi:hypothetical protein